MIEAWLRLSLTIRSASPVIAGITPVLAPKPDGNVRTASVCLNLARVASSSSWRRHRPGDRPDGTRARAERLDGRQGRGPQPGMVGQARGSRSS